MAASVRLPGANNVSGLWPAVWTMGNLGDNYNHLLNSSDLISSVLDLGRAGYGASLEGMVCLISFPYNLVQPLTLGNGMRYRSGRIAMTLVMSAHYRTKAFPTPNCPHLHSRMAIPHTTTSSYVCHLTFNLPSVFQLLLSGLQSVLQGQRLSACTCPGEPHPGPSFANGSFAGRGSPEIDVFEATISGQFGQVSQSGQWAPFNVST